MRVLYLAFQFCQLLSSSTKVITTSSLNMAIIFNDLFSYNQDFPMTTNFYVYHHRLVQQVWNQIYPNSAQLILFRKQSNVLSQSQRSVSKGRQPLINSVQTLLRQSMPLSRNGYLTIIHTNAQTICSSHTCSLSTTKKCRYKYLPSVSAYMN